MVRTNLDTDSADRSPADFLKMLLHVFTAFLRIKHIIPLTVDRPFRAFDCAGRTGLDAFVARTADRNRLDIGHVKRTIRKNRSEAHGPYSLWINSELLPIVPSPESVAVFLWEYRPL